MSKVTHRDKELSDGVSSKDNTEIEERKRKKQKDISSPAGAEPENGIIILESPEINHPDKIRSEVNFLVYPIFKLEKKKNDEAIEVEMTVERGKQRLEVFWGVYSPSIFGIPGPFDKKVFDAIQEIIESLPRPVQNPIPAGSVYSLCQRMGINYSGENYRMIKDSLRRLALISIDSRSTFYDKGRKRWIEEIFHLFDKVILAGEEFPDGTIADENYIFLNSKYLDNINNGYVKPIDYEFYRGLSSNISRRLYELLGVKFYPIFQKNMDVRFIRYLYDTLCDLIPVKKRDRIGLIKQQLAPAITELQEKGFLEKCEIKRENGKVYLYFYPGPRAKEEFNKFKADVEPYQDPQLPEDNSKQLSAPSESEPEKLVKYFYKKNTGRDISEVKPKEIEQAERLLYKYKEEMAHFIVDYAIEEAKKTNFNMKTFGACLQYEREAMEKYEITQKLKQKEEEDKRRKAEEERLKEEEKERAEEEEIKINEILNNLSEEELEEVQKEALARAEERSSAFVKEGKPIPGIIINLCIKEIIREKYLRETVTHNK
ncbi:MAG TPA: replication initiator protein A [bacterium]|nr:replication initiator protein A [bacterium]